MNKIYEQVQDHAEELTDIYYQLKDLSSAFYKTGNDKISEMLFIVGEKIEKIYKNLNKISSDIVDQDFKQSLKNTNNVIMASLAGIELSKTTK